MTKKMNKCRIAFLLVFLMVTLNISAVLAQTVDLELRRHAYYRGESILLMLATSAEIKDAQVDIYLGEIKVISSLLRSTKQEIEVPVANVRAGDYLLKAVVHAETGEIVGESRVAIASRPSPHQIDVWLWGGGEGGYYFDHGFTIAGGPHWDYWREDNRDAYIKNLDAMLVRGAGATIWLCGGISRRDLKGVAPDADDVE
jgi:hypothetical protein